MAVMPVMVVPVVVPMAMPVMVPVAVMVPVHFFRLDAIDVVLRYDSGFSVDGRRSSLNAADTGGSGAACALAASITPPATNPIVSFKMSRRSIASVPFLNEIRTGSLAASR